MNTQRLVGGIGILRILTLVLGVVVLILTGIYHYPDIKEQFFFSVVIMLLFFSVVVLVLLLLDFLKPSLANSVDMSFHLIGGFILILATGIMLYSVFRIGDQCTFYYKVGMKCPSLYQPYIPRIILAILSFVNGIIYCLTGILIKRTEYI